MTSILFSICLVSLAYIVVKLTSRSRLPLPPGPKTTFFSGSFLRSLRDKPWLAYRKWSEIYGPILYFRVYGRRTLVLNSVKAVTDLLETRSSIYSERPKSWMVRLAGRNSSVFWTSSTHPRFKKYRTMLQSGLNARAVEDYRHVLEQETLAFLKDLLHAPEDFMSSIQRNAAAVILRLTYGYAFSDTKDSFTSAMQRANEMQIQLLRPGWLVESFPLLRFLPAWFPGAQFKRFAERCEVDMRDIETAPYLWAKSQIKSGNHLDSFTSRHLDLLDTSMLGRAEEEEIIKWCGAALFAGGADTMSSVIESFFLAMTLYPDVQRKAQAEIDSVVGHDRLPGTQDEDDTTYIPALIKEVLRWAPVGPLGLPHCVTEDDAYGGYRIPKGTSVVANIWAITHDPKIYPKPADFSPERFIGAYPQPDPKKYVFGFGRRACPGQNFVQASLFRTIANILAVFNITKSVDEHGREITPVADFTSSPASHPKPFKCRIVPRSEEALAVLHTASDVS